MYLFRRLRTMRSLRLEESFGTSWRDRTVRFSEWTPYIGLLTSPQFHHRSSLLPLYTVTLHRKFQLMNLPEKSITLQTQRSPDLLAGFKGGALRQRGEVEKETGSKKGKRGRKKERRQERKKGGLTCSIASRGNRRPWLHFNYSSLLSQQSSTLSHRLSRGIHRPFAHVNSVPRWHANKSKYYL